MKRLSLVGLLTAALCVMIAGTASAAKKPTNLTLSTAKGALAAGAPVKAESTDLIFETSAGNLECTSNVIEGTVGNNDAKKDSGSVTAEKSSGGEPGGLCKTTTPFGATEISVANLPWTDVFTSKGGNEVKGKKVSFTSTFPGAGGAKCIFEASKVKSSFTIGGPVQLVTSKQKFKASKKLSNPQCPKEGTLSGHWTVTSGGETVTSELTL